MDRVEKDWIESIELSDTISLSQTAKIVKNTINHLLLRMFFL